MRITIVEDIACWCLDQVTYSSFFHILRQLFTTEKECSIRGFRCQYFCVFYFNFTSPFDFYTSPNMPCCMDTRLQISCRGTYRNLWNKMRFSFAQRNQAPDTEHLCFLGTQLSQSLLGHFPLRNRDKFLLLSIHTNHNISHMHQPALCYHLFSQYNSVIDFISFADSC